MTPPVGGWAMLLVIAVAAAAPAATQQPVPAGAVRSGTLSFDGRASLGDFTGTTTTVSGEMSGGSSLRMVRGWVEAPVATLVTGNGRRDRDLRSALEADDHPNLRFDLDGVSLVGPVGDSTRVMLSGRLTIRGVTRDTGVPAVVSRSAEGIRVRSDFAVNLHDYGVTGLSRMLGILRMHPDIVVHVDLLFAPGGDGGGPREAARSEPPPGSA